MLGDFLAELAFNGKADEYGNGYFGSQNKLHKDRSNGMGCFTQEWNLWWDRYSRYGDHNYTLPVPSSIEISRDHIPRNQGTYTAEDMDRNGDGYISQDEFESFYENWLDQRTKNK